MSIYNFDELDDYIFATSRADWISTGSGNDIIYGNGGRDIIWAGAGDDIIFGGRRRDKIYAGEGDDYLSGGHGNDKLYGGAGDDTLDGGIGRDQIHGGTGFDVAVYQGDFTEYDWAEIASGHFVIAANSGVVDWGQDHLFGVEALYFVASGRLIYLDGRPTEIVPEDDHFAIRANQHITIEFAQLFENDQNWDGAAVNLSDFDQRSSRGVDILVDDHSVTYALNGDFDDLVENATIEDQFYYTLTTSDGKDYKMSVTLAITGVNDAPSIEVPDTIAIWENSSFVTKVKSLDPEFEKVEISILDQGDGHLFNFDQSTSKLYFLDPPDFEMPQDADQNNIYSVTLRATDPSGMTAEKTIEITINDSDEIPSLPRINEFHYDDVGLDDNEFVEVRVSNGYDVTDLKLYLYNGKPGLQSVYDVIDIGSREAPLAGLDRAYDYFVWDSPMNGIQNGPDGFALVEGTDVIEFISFEGSFEALDGPAAGMISNAIGVWETNSGSDVQSLQRLEGDEWTGPIDHTRGSANTDVAAAELMDFLA